MPATPLPSSRPVPVPAFPGSFALSPPPSANVVELPDRIFRDRWQAALRHSNELERELEAMRRQNRELKRLIGTDPLTGLHNRLAMEKLLAPRWEAEGSGSLLLFDLDSFKTINDDFGHETGDRILASFGAILSMNTRREDRAVRYGGEEFLVLVAGALEEEARVVADRIRRATERTIFAEGIRMTVSAGIASGAPPVFEELFAAADAALYRAKRAGRNRVIVAGN